MSLIRRRKRQVSHDMSSSLLIPSQCALSHACLYTAGLRPVCSAQQVEGMGVRVKDLKHLLGLRCRLGDAALGSVHAMLTHDVCGLILMEVQLADRHLEAQPG